MKKYFYILFYILLISSVFAGTQVFKNDIKVEGDIIISSNIAGTKGIVFQDGSIQISAITESTDSITGILSLNQIPFASSSNTITSTQQYSIDNTDTNSSKLKITSPDTTKFTQIATDQLWNVGQIYTTAATLELWNNANKNFYIDSAGNCYTNNLYATNISTSTTTLRNDLTTETNARINADIAIAASTTTLNNLKVSKTGDTMTGDLIMSNSNLVFSTTTGSNGITFQDGTILTSTATIIQSLQWGNITGTLSNQIDLQNQLTNISLSTTTLQEEIDNIMLSTGNFVSKTGDTMTGDLTLPSLISNYSISINTDTVSNNLFNIVSYSTSNFLDQYTSNEQQYSTTEYIWQSFTPAWTGLLRQLAIKLGGNSGANILNIYEGVGVGGNKIYTQAITSLPVVGWNTITLTNPFLVSSGSHYTFEFTNNLTVRYGDYAGGQSSIGSRDVMFQSYMSTTTATTSAFKTDILGTNTASNLTIENDCNLSFLSYFYFGNSTTNGSWRFRINGNDLVFERRESGSWVEKSKFTA